MLPRTPPRLLANFHWPFIVDRLLDGTDHERRKARHLMWEQVEQYIIWRAKLPMGRLNDDEEVRRDLAVRVLARLEKREYHHIRQWRERRHQREHQRRKHAGWWRFVQVATWSAAVDLARTSRRQLAPRGKPFQWAHEVPMDPIMMDTSVDQLRDYFVELQHVLRGDEEPAGETTPSEPNSEPEPAGERAASEASKPEWEEETPVEPE